MKKDQRWNERLELPAEVVSNQPLTTLRGNRSVSIEHHGGIVEYGENVVRVRTSIGTVRITGTQLCICVMTRQLLEVRGMVASVELE